MERIEKIATKLSAASIKWVSDPYSLFNWPDKLDMNHWYFSPELISIYGTEIYDSLDEGQKKQLAFWEAVNFFSINIHGEKALLKGLADRLYKNRPREITDYLHHFLEEENKHMVVFGSFCELYGNKVYTDKKLNIPTEYDDGEEEFLFFSKVVIFEELVDRYNQNMAKDERLDKLVRQINEYHHNDESRHLAFGREITRKLFNEYADKWSDQTITRVRQYLADYMGSTWREYYNPDVYSDAGMDNAYEIYEDALESEVCRAHRLNISENCIQFFIESGIFQEVPEL